MIDPEQLRRKAENLYPAFLAAWLEGVPFFPCEIRCDKRPEGSQAEAAAAVQRLRAESKEVKRCGYTIQWEDRNSRQYGRNLFPKRIVVESEDDLLGWIGKQRDFRRFTSAVARIRSRLPELDQWIAANTDTLVRASDDIDGLIDVTLWLRDHPRPNQFPRELPLQVDTKFIERYQSILRSWFDIVLPPAAIRADEDHFERRYGLRYLEPQLLIRFLDPAVQLATGVPWSQCSVGLHDLARTPIPAQRVLVVENKTNLLTLPPLRDAVALGGLGYGVTDLRYVEWLHDRGVFYWGDIDLDGFHILARLRMHFPQVQSLMMDEAFAQRLPSDIRDRATSRSLIAPLHLREPERAMYERCQRENLRIEQERIPQSLVRKELAQAFGGM